MIRSSAGFLFAVVVSGSALAQGDARFCGSYAANASGMGDAAVKKNPACLDYSRGVHDNYQSHFDWCMKNSPSSVQGAEANIRRLVSACTGNAARPAPIGAAPPAPAPKYGAGVAWGSQEPFGPGFDGWTLSQEATKQGALCRAVFHNSNLIARRADGFMYVSIPAGNIPSGTYHDTHFEIGGEAEPVRATSNGQRFVIESDEGFLDKLAGAQGYLWRLTVKGKQMEGRVAFNGSTGRALQELQKCVKANR